MLPFSKCLNYFRNTEKKKRGRFRWGAGCHGVRGVRPRGLRPAEGPARGAGCRACQTWPYLSTFLWEISELKSSQNVLKNKISIVFECSEIIAKFRQNVTKIEHEKLLKSKSNESYQKLNLFFFWVKDTGAVQAYVSLIDLVKSFPIIFFSNRIPIPTSIQ